MKLYEQLLAANDKLTEAEVLAQAKAVRDAGDAIWAACLAMANLPGNMSSTTLALFSDAQALGDALRYEGAVLFRCEQQEADWVAICRANVDRLVSDGAMAADLIAAFDDGYADAVSDDRYYLTVGGVAVIYGVEA
jgi:hypothetical protein